MGFNAIAVVMPHLSRVKQNLKFNTELGRNDRRVRNVNLNELLDVTLIIGPGPKINTLNLCSYL